MFSGIVSGPGPPVPPRCPTVSQTIQCYNSCFAPNPHPIYSASPSLLPPPTLWTQGVVTWCFFSGECGLLVNSWATIHSEGKSSQVKTWWLCTSTLQQRAKDMNIEQQNKPVVFQSFNKSLHFNDTKRDNSYIVCDSSFLSLSVEFFKLILSS